MDFNTPTESFGELGADETAALMTAATDIALVIDTNGVIRDVSQNSNELPANEYQSWINRPWVDTVTIESRPKVEELLQDALADSRSRWRHINHPSTSGADVPITYLTVSIGKTGRILAIGRSAVRIAELQQRLLQAQQSMEKNYLKIRHLETRYRLLFQVCSEAVFVVDMVSLKVLEANFAAEQLLASEKSRMNGQPLTKFFKTADGSIENLLNEVRSSGGPGQLQVRLTNSAEVCLMSASLIPEEGNPLGLVRLNPQDSSTAQAADTKTQSRLSRIVESIPDGFVVTGADGSILLTNSAFLELTQTTSPNRVQGESLDKWFGRSAVDLNVLMANLRKHGSVRLFATTLRGEYGSSVDVEVSAVRVLESENEECFVFLIRDTGVRLDDSAYRGRRLSRPVEQLTELVGRLPLRELVQESTDMVERYCIEAALEITGENRTLAADILGLSRQSLYVKLRRYGLGSADDRG